MRTTGERLKYVIESQGFNPKSFCAKFNMNYTGMNMIINNDRSLGMNILLQIKKAIPNLDANWLLFGEPEKEGIHKYENLPEISVAEPGVHLYDEIDPVEEMFLKYLDRPMVQEKIKMILKK